jgi:hypothetical protein
MWAIGLLHDPSDWKAAPNHLKVVVLAGAANDGWPQRNGFQIVSRHRMSPIRLLEASQYRYSHPGQRDNSPLAVSSGNMPLLTNPVGSVNLFLWSVPALGK